MWERVNQGKRPRRGEPQDLGRLTSCLLMPTKYAKGRVGEGLAMDLKSFGDSTVMDVDVDTEEGGEEGGVAQWLTNWIIFSLYYFVEY